MPFFFDLPAPRAWISPLILLVPLYLHTPSPPVLLLLVSHCLSPPDFAFFLQTGVLFSYGTYSWTESFIVSAFFSISLVLGGVLGFGCNGWKRNMGRALLLWAFSGLVWWNVNNGGGGVISREFMAKSSGFGMDKGFGMDFNGWGMESSDLGRSLNGLGMKSRELWSNHGWDVLDLGGSFMRFSEVLSKSGEFLMKCGNDFINGWDAFESELGEVFMKSNGFMKSRDMINGIAGMHVDSLMIEKCLWLCMGLGAVSGFALPGMGKSVGMGLIGMIVNVMLINLLWNTVDKELFQVHGMHSWMNSLVVGMCLWTFIGLQAWLVGNGLQWTGRWVVKGLGGVVVCVGMVDMVWKIMDWRSSGGYAMPFWTESFVVGTCFCTWIWAGTMLSPRRERLIEMGFLVVIAITVWKAMDEQVRVFAMHGMHSWMDSMLFGNFTILFWAWVGVGTALVLRLSGTRNIAGVALGIASMSRVALHMVKLSNTAQVLHVEEDSWWIANVGTAWIDLAKTLGWQTVDVQKPNDVQSDVRVVVTYGVAMLNTLLRALEVPFEAWLTYICKMTYLVWWIRAHPQTIIATVFKVVCAVAATFMFAKRKELPESGWEVRKEWLECEFKRVGVLQAKDFITSVKASSLGGNGFMGETVRVHVEYNNSEDTKHLPKTLVAKTTPSASLARKARMRGATSLYYRESAFYALFAPRILAQSSLKIPRVLVNRYDSFSGSYVLIMTDATEDHGSLKMTPGDETKGSTFEQACSVATRYASFHALFWCDSLQELNKKHNTAWLSTFDWMNPCSPLILKDVVFPAFEEVLLDDELREHVPIRVQRALMNMMCNLSEVFDRMKRTKPFTIIHADARAENMLFDPANPTQNWISLDWQTMTKSLGIYDLAYFVSLDVPLVGEEDDFELVRRYHNTLVEKGVRGYPLHDCMYDYRLCIMIAALIPNVVMSPKSIGNERAAEAKIVRRSMLRRSSKAILRMNADVAMDEFIRAAVPPSRPARVLRTVFPKAVHDENNCLLEATDDAFSHHTAESILKLPPGKRPLPGYGRRDTYDRWYLNGYSPDRNVFFAVGCGFYPGRRVVDASFSLVVDGIQHNVRASRSSSDADFNSKNTLVGPIRIQVLEPLVSARLLVDFISEDGSRRIKCNLVYTKRHAACKEPRFNTEFFGGTGRFDYERLTQIVQWSGTIQVDDAHEITMENWPGTRDRSWGARPHMAADRPGKVNKLVTNLLDTYVGRRLGSLSKKTQFYWFWCPLNFTSSCEFSGLLLHSQESSDGFKTNSAVKLLRGEEGECVEPLSSELVVTYKPNTRHVATCRIEIHLQDERKVTIECRPRFPFFMSGVGYNAITMSHGALLVKSGSNQLHVEYDRICTEFANRNGFLQMHIQEVCDVFGRIDSNQSSMEFRGSGVMEQLVVGPHEPSGFEGFYET